MEASYWVKTPNKKAYHLHIAAFKQHTARSLKQPLGKANARQSVSGVRIIRVQAPGVCDSLFLTTICTRKTSIALMLLR